MNLFQCVWFICVFVCIIPTYHPTRNQVSGILHHSYNAEDLFWKFMTSRYIYLDLSSANISYVSCIRAETIAENKSARTLSQRVDVKVKNSDRWVSLNASYAPIEFTSEGNVKTFTSYDNDSNAVTNYTFLLSTSTCAVVLKSKDTNGTGPVESRELWVNDKFSSIDMAACEDAFTNHCNCDGGFFSYDIYECKGYWTSGHNG
uniref:Lipocalin n=1 Tax=Rhipicephalus zambeziensis TaxID=60191 RepID=A0A224YE51_9ACAR